MSHTRVSAWAALALLGFAAGCASAEPRPPSQASFGVTNMQPAPVQEQDRGWAALVEADRQVKMLASIRDSMDDPLYRDSVTQQIDSILVRSDKLLDELSAGDGQVHDRQIRQLTADLQRTMAIGAAEMQRGPGETP